ncbi:MAG TPA: sigma factor-like helix-turn-helix DNA-binding protein [Propionibacteriaceae bacterium]|nr:sigma factor-like helix-turn-helix DNA-binding protein [Propionibacteriaceae bacterium]
MHADDLADLLRWCAALSIDPADLAGEVMVAAGQRWSALVDSPPDLRELTVRTFLQTAQAPDLAVREGLEHLPEELRTVVAAYDKLPKLQRAVLMLSYLEGITNAEIGGIVDRTAARVQLELDRGLAAIGWDPYSVRAALDITSWHLPTPADVTRAFQRHAKARARRRRRIGLVGVAVGTVVAVLLSVSAVHRTPVEPRQPGVWAFSHMVRPLQGWSVQGRTLERHWETTTLNADPPESGRCSVAVGTSGASWVRRLPRHPTKVRVGTRAAFYADRVWRSRGGAMLWWEYADAALVIIECGNLTAPRVLLPKLAGRVVLSAEPVLLPYRVRSAPSRYQVSSVTKGLVSNSTVAYLTRNDYPEGLLQISIRYPASLPMYSVNYSSLMSRYANGRHAASCRAFGDSHICVNADLPTRDAFNVAQQPEVLAVLDRIASNLELAPSATDLDSWFDAREALPS